MPDDAPQPSASIDILDPPLYPQGEHFSPNSWAQWRVYTSTSPDLLYSGRLGCGKTKLLCEKGDDRCRSFSPARVAVCRRFREHIGSSILPELRKAITPAHWQWGYRRAEDGGSTLFYPNGSQILLLGLDNPQRLQSTEFDLILIEQCEEVDEEQWQFASGRLRNRALPLDEDGIPMDGPAAPQQIVGACNPESPMHFLYRSFRPDAGSHMQWTTEPTLLPNGHVIPPGDVLREVVCAGALDNLENLDPRYLARLQRMKGRYYERMVLGKWIAFEGMVYDVFDHDLHVIARPKSWSEWGGYPPPSWERMRGIDFGYHPDPFVCRWYVRNPSAGAWIMYREIYMTNRIVSAHARTILREEEKELATAQRYAAQYGHSVPRYINLIGSYADHDAEDRATLESEGVVTERAIKDRSPGIQTMYDLLTPEVRDGRLQPRLFYVRPEESLVERDEARADLGLPTCGIEEIASYRFDPKKAGKTLGEDHAMDADRYTHHTHAMRGDARCVLI